MTLYYGKYRGKVSQNKDPDKLGRVQVTCPAVLGDGQASWAMPCVPFAGNGVGFFTVPPEGANVWIEFEGGDQNHPILAGCFWGDDEVPAEDGNPDLKVWKTNGVTLTINDKKNDGGLTIEVKPPVVSKPLTLKFSSDGIELVNGQSKVKLSDTTVSVNDDALEVT